MNITMRLGVETDIDELEQLYDCINDYLSENVNYPGWRKGLYPVRETAEEGIRESGLYVALHKERIIGSMILRHKPEPAYLPVKWTVDLDYEDVLVIYTFVVHPDYYGQGVGSELLEHAARVGRQSNIKALRLDVNTENLPAIRLYEKCGFHYVDTVDLGLGEYNLPWFKLYEKIL